MGKIFKPKTQQEIDADISRHFREDNIYGDSLQDLPDYMKADFEMKEKLRAQKELEKKIIIDLGKLKLKGTSMTILKLIGGIAALIIAFVFTFIAPGAGAEQLVIGVVTSILGALGVSNWRVNYGLAKDWFKSKSIVSAILVMVIIVAVTLLSFFSIGLPPLVVTILQGVIVALGGSMLWGIFDASKAGK